MNQLSVNEVVAALRLAPEVATVLERNWTRSITELPDELPGFLRQEVIRDSFSGSGIPAEVLPDLEQMAREIAADPYRLALAWHGYRCLTVYDSPHFAAWPELDARFYLLLALSIVPLLFERYRERGLPEEAAAACIAYYGNNYNALLKNTGRSGWDRRTLHWVRHYIDLNCFQIGRLQYMLTWARAYNTVVFRHRRSGQILAGSGPEFRRFNAEGLVCFPDETAVIAGTGIETPANAEVIPFDPHGFALPNPVRLDFSEWEMVVSPSDRVLGVHIPTGGQMTLEKCEDSFRHAVQFFKTYFPEIDNKAFFSSSWIFSPYYEKALPDSNLARFMRELYLCPCSSSGTDGVLFIFGREDANYQDYPGDNSIRRAMLKVLNGGGRLRSGGMFFLLEHLDRFGTQCYRRQPPDFN